MAGSKAADEDLDTLINSHVALSRQVSNLSAKVSDLSRSTAAGFEAVRRFQARESNADYRRLLLFATMNASKLLRTPHPDLSTAAMKIHPWSTVKQTLLKSKASDCSLADFRLLVQSFLQEESLKCMVHPSEFYVMCTDAATPERFDIFFDSFSDICDALSISTNVREAGAYREKTKSGELLAVQVTGTVRLGQGEGSNRSRAILLGQGQRTSPNSRRVHLLYQESIAWTENSWEMGFELQNKTIFDVMKSTFPLDSTTEAENRSASPLNLPPDHRFSFRITWERNPNTLRYPHMADSMVAGSIRSYFPAVSIGTRILTNSVKDIFTSKVNGRLLKEVLVSPETSI